MLHFINKTLIWKFIKFGIVGLSGVVVDFSFTYICKEWIKIPKYIANAIGFTIAATTNYYLNRVWTFHSNNPEITIEFIKFFIVSLIGLAVNTVILWILVSKFKQHFYLSKLFAIGVVMIWNFIANLIYTFATQ